MTLTFLDVVTWVDGFAWNKKKVVVHVHVRECPSLDVCWFEDRLQTFNLCVVLVVELRIFNPKKLTAQIHYGKWSMRGSEETQKGRQANMCS